VAEHPHYPVLYNEIIHALQPRSGGVYVDGTLGAGGHAEGILNASSPDGLLLGLDVDPQAIEIARVKLATFGARVVIRQASYTSIGDQLEALGWREVNGVLLDLGVSSMQLDNPERGFSFSKEAPLDMRFSPENPTRAADLINDLSEQDLTELIYWYGEERSARQIAKAIVKARPIETTTRLAEIVSQAMGYRAARSRAKSGKYEKKLLHPATRTFQALRITVNRELETLEAGLPTVMQVLAPGGRLAVIAFHSLEDKIVKDFFRRESKDCICPPRQPVCTCGHRANLIELGRTPIRPTDEEIHINPRSRSARLRLAEKLAH